MRSRRIALTVTAAAATTALVATATAMVPGLLPGAVAAHPPRPTCTSSVPYAAGGDDYASFRIPAVITAGRQLLAFAEGRVNSSDDSGDIDLVLRRSSDGGCTWGPLQVVAAGNGDTRGNPSPVYDPATRQVVLVTTYNAGSVNITQIAKGQVTPEQSRRVFVQTSGDEGATFTAPREITAQAKQADWRWYATGPGHALLLTTGAHKGRIVVASDHSYAPPAGSTDLGNESKYFGGHDIYSDDHGQTWHIGYVEHTPHSSIDAGESTAAQLPDGRVFVNTRTNGTAPGTRADAYSTDGGASLTTHFVPQDTIPGPVCEGSVLQLTGRDPALLYSGDADPNARAAMTIRISRDGGVTWPDAVPISGLPAAYSDLVQLDARTVGLFYETGTTSSYSQMTFRRLDIGSLTR